jgi:hypothetical protein
MSGTNWARVMTVIEAVDPAPPDNARALIDALIYLALTDSCWDDLPAIYPTPAQVAVAAARWRALGLFTHLESILFGDLDD